MFQDHKTSSQDINQFLIHQYSLRPVFTYLQQYSTITIRNYVSALYIKFTSFDASVILFVGIFCTAYRPGRHGPTHNLYLFRSLLGFTFKNFLYFNLSVTDVFINKKSHTIQGCSEKISWKEKLHFLRINSAEFFLKGTNQTRINGF